MRFHENMIKFLADCIFEIDYPEIFDRQKSIQGDSLLSPYLIVQIAKSSK